MSGDSLPEVSPERQFAQLAMGHRIDGRFTHEKKGHHHHQECAEHQAKHPWWGHIVGQKACENVAERHTALLCQEHNRKDPPSVPIGGQQLIGRIARIQAQQPEATAGDQDA